MTLPIEAGPIEAGPIEAGPIEAGPIEAGPIEAGAPMPPHRSRWGGGSRQAFSREGFSLIELLVVLAVMGLALTLIAGYKAPWSRTLGLEGTAAELASGLRLARSQAIADNHPVAFALDLAGHRYRVGNAPPHPLPTRLAIGLLTVNGEKLNATAGDIRFNPDGSSTGGRITLADGSQRMAVGVDWLTGRVTVADVR